MIRLFSHFISPSPQLYSKFKTRKKFLKAERVASRTFEFPCKNYCMDSQETSVSFSVTTRLGGRLVQIHTKFHDYSMSFIQILFVFHAGTLYGLWTSSSHRISMAFVKKMMGFPSDLVSFLTKLPSNLCHIFTGLILIFRVMTVS